ncbi:hypothetical protein ACIRRA_16910 [Nocardia sp. NPDC101769]|uniref:hypothetical protein n=1 Tax=Nocardia sp. NPDC101769 TaxID=3364333 RepID=UPI0037F2897B
MPLEYWRLVAGDCEIAVASGVEQVGRIPMGTSLLDVDNLIGAGFLERCPQGVPWRGISAELITARWISTAPSSTTGDRDALPADRITHAAG